MKKVILIFLVCLPQLLFASSEKTGIFKDVDGFVDPVSKQEISSSQNLGGMWFVSIKTQYSKKDVVSVLAFDVDGQQIEMAQKAGLSQYIINGKLVSGTTKLYLKAAKGKPFYLIYEIKE